MGGRGGEEDEQPGVVRPCSRRVVLRLLWDRKARRKRMSATAGAVRDE